MVDVRIPSDFANIVLDRMALSGAPAADRRDALAMLALILANLETQSRVCRRTVRDLVDALGLSAADTIRVVRLLANVQAVALVDRHRRRALAVTPPGVYLSRRPRTATGIAASIGCKAGPMHRAHGLHTRCVHPENGRVRT